MHFSSGITKQYVVIGAAIVAILGFFIPLFLDAYSAYTGMLNWESCLENGIRHTIVFPINITLINRPELQKDLERMITPHVPGRVSSYFLITGEHGTGKTTAIKQTCAKVGEGVIYVDVPENIAKFGDVFAASTCYRPVASNLPSNMDKWEVVFDEFQEKAKAYKLKHQKVPVLVIDNVNYLALKAPKILEILQGAAKSAVDEEDFVTVFVASDDIASQQMRSKSAFSRGRLYRIGDVSEKQVVEYLAKHQLIKDTAMLTDEEKMLSSKIFDLVGGRLQPLKMVSNELKSGISFEDIKSLQMYKIVSRIAGITLSR